VEVNQASPITTSSPEILTRNGLVPPFQCHHSSSPRRGVSLQNTTPQQQQQQKTRTTTRFPLLFLPVKAKKKRKKREREIERERDQETNQTHHPKTKPKSSSGRNFPSTLHHKQLSKLNPAWVVEKMGPPSVESVTWEGGGEYVLTAVSSSASSNFLQFA
jgi:hypothetical protein